jgi:hypothetical protein
VEDMPRKPIKNGLQRRQFGRGERRLRGHELTSYLARANSEDSKERLEAMKNLCPCHVRKRVDAAWNALYRGLQDIDLKVRQAAWHTLEENHGGRPNGPKLYPLMVAISKTEENPKLRQKAKSIVRKAQSQKQNIEDKKHDLLGKRSNYFQGKCDWCGDSSAEVDYLYDSEIQIGATVRLAQACDTCRSEYGL